MKAIGKNINPGVVKLANTRDLKSLGEISLSVQVRSPGPKDEKLDN